MKRYKIREDMTLVIEDCTINKMYRYCQQRGMNEAGGILLGKIKSDYSEVVITDLSEPCSRDKRGKYFFVRNKDNAQEIVNINWCSSEGEINYLGEWHTHPENNPAPSYTDMKLIKDSLENNKNTPDMIFLIIVGMNASLYVGYMNRGTKELHQLNDEC